jgi:hypothetical protein
MLFVLCCYAAGPSPFECMLRSAFGACLQLQALCSCAVLRLRSIEMYDAPFSVVPLCCVRSTLDNTVCSWLLCCVALLFL